VPKSAGYSKAISYEISAGGRIDYQFDPGANMTSHGHSW
jgi:hypothetical protein